MLDVLQIGASRAGSTWLWRMLLEHPEVCFPIRGPRAPKGRKSGWFWNNASPFWKDKHVGKVKERAIRTLKDYRNEFDPNIKGKIKVDITEGAAYIPESRIQLIKQTYPDVKILYCIRNPITTFWSHATYAGSSLSKAFTHSGGNLIRNVQYMQNLKRWKKHFAEERIRVYFFSQIRDNPIVLLKTLSQFMDIDPSFWDTLPQKQITEKRNPNKKKAKPNDKDLKMLVKKFETEVRQIEQHFEKDLSHWLDGKE